MKHAMVILSVLFLVGCGSSGGSSRDSGSSVRVDEQPIIVVREPSTDNDKTVPNGSNLVVPRFTIVSEATPIPRSWSFVRNYGFEASYYPFSVEGIRFGNYIRLFETYYSYPYVRSVGGGYYNPNDDSGLIYYETSGGEITIETEGPDFYGLPSGLNTYKGFNVAVSPQGIGWEGQGSFVMEVNFDNGRGYLKGSTDTYGRSGHYWTSNISGPISIGVGGDFTGSNLLLRVSNVETYARISGNFGGENAFSVSGTYKGFSDNSNVVGGIVGYQLD